MPKRARCVEVGVWTGDFSERILRSTTPRELNLVDPWRFAPEFPKRYYGGLLAENQADMDAIHAGVVKRFGQYLSVNVHRKTSLEAAASFDDRSLDWVYIDGDHSYDAVRADLQAWWPKIVAGGLLTGDDVGWRDEGGKQPVRQAVVEFCSRLGMTSARSVDNQFIIRSTG